MQMTKRALCQQGEDIALLLQPNKSWADQPSSFILSQKGNTVIAEEDEQGSNPVSVDKLTVL